MRGLYFPPIKLRVAATGQLSFEQSFVIWIPFDSIFLGSIAHYSAYLYLRYCSDIVENVLPETQPSSLYERRH